MRIKQSFLWIFAWLTLKPYGQYLLCNDTAMWIFSVRLIMLVLISTECASWGYAARLMGGREYGEVACWFAAIAAFTLNWTLDGSIMMLDRDKLFAALRPGGHDRKSAVSPIKVLSLVLGRMVMISALLYSTSTFLVQALFNEDIVTGLANANRALIEQTQKDLLMPLHTREVELLKLIVDKENELTKEVQGESRDGKKGCGPACSVLKDELADERASLAEVKAKEKVVQEAFEHKGPAELKDLYHIQLLGNGMEARGVIVEQLQKNNGFKRTERSIQGALFILFLGLLLLKFFQPPSVMIYFSAALQDLHKRYRDEALNELLRANEVPGNRPGGMTPHEFAKWAEMVYLPVLKNKGRHQQQTIMEQDYATQKSQLLDQEDSLETDLDATTSKQRELSEQGMAIEKEMNHAKAEAETLGVQINLFEDEHTKLSDALSHQSIPIDAYAIILTRAERLTQAIRQQSEARDGFKATFQDGSKRLAQLRFDQGRLAEYASGLRDGLKFARDEKMEMQRAHLERLREFWKAQERVHETKRADADEQEDRRKAG